MHRTYIGGFPRTQNYRSRSRRRPRIQPHMLEGLEPRVLLAAHLSVSFNGTNLPDNAAPIDFGSVTIGQTASTRTFTLNNDGDQPLDLALDDTNSEFPQVFNVITALPSHLDAGQSGTFALSLKTATARSAGFIAVAGIDYTDPSFATTLF